MAKQKTGAYAKLLANYAEDDAVIEAGEKAELLFVRGLAFCADSDADGFITDAQLARIVGAGMRDAHARARKLVEVGLWRREEGGYLVRSWTKLHETAEQRGRRLKADRERKMSARTPQPIPDGQKPGIQPESEQNTDPHPPDSLSMTVQHSAAQSSTAVTPSRGQRPETPPPPDATQRPNPPTHDRRRCTEHQGVADPPPCAGCRNARERADREDQTAEDRERDRRQRELEAARNACTRCDGTWLTDDAGNPTTKKCDHGTRRAS